MDQTNSSMLPHIFIAGGAAVDIISQVAGKSRQDDFDKCLNNSNMGEIKIRAGGSARNCAECLCRLFAKYQHSSS